MNSPRKQEEMPRARPSSHSFPRRHIFPRVHDTWVSAGAVRFVAGPLSFSWKLWIPLSTPLGIPVCFECLEAMLGLAEGKPCPCVPLVRFRLSLRRTSTLVIVARPFSNDYLQVNREKKSYWECVFCSHT